MTSELESVGQASYPQHRPEQNEKLPWAINYRDGIRIDGKKSPAGTYYFKDAREAVIWRAVMLLSPIDSPF